MRSLAVTVLVLALLGGTAAAFAVTEALKLERSPVTAPRFTKHFSPVCKCEKEVARLALRLRKADTVDAAIVDSDGEVVRTLVEDERSSRGPVAFEWDGRDDAGERVADGRYRLRLRLDRQHRTIVFPNPIFVDTESPRLRLLAVQPQVFSPDGDGRSDRVRLTYVASEPAKGTLFADAEPARIGKLRAEGRASMVWDGAVLGRPAEPGLYALSIRVEDRAGNVSDPTEPVAVVLRYVEVAPSRLTARRGGVVRFRVSSDAAAVTWTIAHRRTGRLVLGGEADPAATVTVRLPQRVRPGRYVLRVTANGHRDTAPLRVR